MKSRIAIAVLCVLLLAIANSATTVAAGTPGGALDPAFGDDGATTVSIGPTLNRAVSGSQAADSATDGSGRTIVIGSTIRDRYEFKDWAIAAIKPDGTLDPSFGTGGRIHQRFQKRGSVPRRDYWASSVAVRSNGRVVVGGIVDRSTGRDFDRAYELIGDDGGELGISRRMFALMQYTADGKRDRTFGRNGLAMVTEMGREWLLDASTDVSDIALDNRGRVLVAGVDPSNRIVIVRFTRRGRIDLSFGRRGIAVVSRMSNYRDSDGAVGRIALDAQQRILLPIDSQKCVGKKRICRGMWRIVRLGANGNHDRRFGRAGVASIVWGETFFVTDSIVQTDLPTVVPINGGLVLAGSAEVPGRNEISVVAVALSDAGVRDLTFGTGGVLTLSSPSPDGQQARVPRLIASPTGRLLALILGCPPGAGACSTSGRMYTVGFTQNGHIDPSWGTAGYAVATPASQSGSLTPTSLSLSSSHLIISASSFNPGNDRSDFFLSAQHLTNPSAN